MERQSVEAMVAVAKTKTAQTLIVAALVSVVTGAAGWIVGWNTSRTRIMELEARANAFDRHVSDTASRDEKLAKIAESVDGLDEQGVTRSKDVWRFFVLIEACPCTRRRTYVQCPARCPEGEEYDRLVGLKWKPESAARKVLGYGVPSGR